MEKEKPAKYRLDRNEFGLTANEMQVLAMLDNPPYSEIADRMGTSKQRVGQIVSGLKRKDMVVKDGSRLRLTDQALTILDKGRYRPKTKETP